MTVTITLDFDSAAIDAMLRSPTGPVGVYLERVALLVEGEAKRLAPVRKGGVGTPGGRLRSSITHEVVASGGTLVARVGSNVDYLLPVHEGARPHLIVPKSKKALKFKGKGGGTVFAKSVRHPGNKPNPFLRDALLSVRL